MDKKEKSSKGMELLDYLSGGNHELFHSNLLAFIAKNYPDYFKSILNIELEYDPKNVEREKDNFDLSISDGKEYILVLENKMKSLPNINQLEKYNEKIQKHNKKTGTECKKILLTLLGTDANPEEKGWKTISYQQLAQNMQKGFKHLNTYPPYFGQFLNDYIEYINKLYEDLINWQKELKEGKSLFGILRYWKDNSIESSWRKLFKAKVIFEYLSADLKKELGNKDYFKISTGVVRAKPFLEIVISFHDGKILNIQDKDVVNHSNYWIQIYPHEIQQGFTIPYNVKSSLKEEKKERKELVEDVWKLLKQNKVFKEIAEFLFNSELFDKNDFKPKLKGKKKMRAYLYDEAAMVYYNEEISEKTSIKDYFAEKAKGIKTILDKYEKITLKN